MTTEPKATSATVTPAQIGEALKWAVQSCIASGRHPLWEGDDALFAAIDEWTARAEAQEAPEPERRDALLRVKAKVREARSRAMTEEREIAYEVCGYWLDAELAKTQPAAPAGEWKAPIEGLAEYRLGIILAVTAELDRAGIPAGALDERVKAQDRLRVGALNAVSELKAECKALTAQRDAAKQEAATASELAMVEAKARREAQAELDLLKRYEQAELGRLRAAENEAKITIATLTKEARAAREANGRLRGFCNEAGKERDAAIAREREAIELRDAARKDADRLLGIVRRSVEYARKGGAPGDYSEDGQVLWLANRVTRLEEDARRMPTETFAVEWREESAKWRALQKLLRDGVGP